MCRDAQSPKSSVYEDEAEISEELAQWLETVDKNRALNPDFLQTVKAVLAANSIFEEIDMVGVSISAFKSSSIPDAGVFGFINRALRKANSVAGTLDSRSSHELLPVRQAEAPHVEEIRAHINIGDGLKKVKLQHLHSDCRPLQAQVDYIATEALKLKRKHEVSKPFVFVELENFMPGFVTSVVKINKKERPPMWLWAVAFEKYALAAACAGQWAYTSSKKHFEICTKIGVRASLDRRCELLAQFYDEVARETWSEAAKRNDEGTSFLFLPCCLLWEPFSLL